MPCVRAPELPSGHNWINSPALQLREFRGRYVLLDFWTYGCINCIHVISHIKALNLQFPDLQVISVHTGKFDRETQQNSIAQAVEKYAIDHPVVIDRGRKIWDNYAIRAYPTFVLIDPQGYILFTCSGETGLTPIKAIIQNKLTGGTSQQSSSVFSSTTPLRFPGKLLTSHGQLFISDSGHHRIVVSSLPNHAGVVSTPPLTIGNGRVGLIDGDFLSAQFHSPQGLAFDPHSNCLYIADTGNHAIRKIDFSTQRVTTIAGNGRQSPTIYPHGGHAKDIALNSPWDLVLIDLTLFLAIAGSHQIWQMDLPTGRLVTYAGSGAEGCFDGPPEIAAFAQPSGITTDGRSLYVADCESSSIREIDLKTGITKTICGSGNLYTFGDRDDTGEAAQLQHPMGLTYTQDALWITDTYNQKIKRFDLKTQECCTIAQDFDEPTGITIGKNHLLIADTNDHHIQQLRFNDNLRQTIEFSELCPPGICLSVR